MRFSAIVAAALTAAPALVSAAGAQGFSLGSVKTDGKCKEQQDYEDDLDAIAKNSDVKIVRGYAASQCSFAQRILPAANKKGFKVILGIWPDVEDSYNLDKGNITEVAKKDEFKDTIYAVTVGSETMYRKNFTGEQLKAKIEDVRKDLPKGIKVGTADSWNRFDDGWADAMIPSADIILINAFAFWQGGGTDGNATNIYFDDMWKAIIHIEKVVGGRDKMPEIWNGETGWPTAVGTDYELAKGGKDNAATFYKKGYCALINWGVNAFYFEAFDEPSKPPTAGDNGKMTDETTWGAFTSDRSPKFELKC